MFDKHKPKKKKNKWSSIIFQLVGIQYLAIFKILVNDLSKIVVEDNNVIHNGFSKNE